MLISWVQRCPLVDYACKERTTEGSKRTGYLQRCRFQFIDHECSSFQRKQISRTVLVCYLTNVYEQIKVFKETG